MESGIDAGQVQHFRDEGYLIVRECIPPAELGRGFIQVTGPDMDTTEKLAMASGRPIIFNVVAIVVVHSSPPSHPSFRVL